MIEDTRYPASFMQCFVFKIVENTLRD